VANFAKLKLQYGLELFNINKKKEKKKRRLIVSVVFDMISSSDISNGIIKN